MYFLSHMLILQAYTLHLPCMWCQPVRNACMVLSELLLGDNCWASGRIDQVEINTMHPTYCHVRCTCTLSMKPGKYQVYLLLLREDHGTKIETATCECAAG